MLGRFESGEVDLERVADELRATCGPSVEGAVFGRWRLNDAVADYLGW